MGFSSGCSSLACAVHGATLALSVLVSPALMAASAQHFSIPAGPLGQALSSFAATAGINLAIDPALVQGRQSPGLEGEVAIASGFARLLSGSGLRGVPG